MGCGGSVRAKKEPTNPLVGFGHSSESEPPVQSGETKITNQPSVEVEPVKDVNADQNVKNTAKTDEVKENDSKVEILVEEKSSVVTKSVTKETGSIDLKTDGTAEEYIPNVEQGEKLTSKAEEEKVLVEDENNAEPTNPLDQVEIKDDSKSAAVEVVKDETTGKETMPALEDQTMEAKSEAHQTVSNGDPEKAKADKADGESDSDTEPLYDGPPLLVLEGQEIRRQSDNAKKLFSHIMHSNDLSQPMSRKDFLQYFREQGETNITSRRLYNKFNPDNSTTMSFEEFKENLQTHTLKNDE